MANVAVIGAQWGDEGKGKVVDWLASRADLVVRFQGGHNAGHTLVVGNETYRLSLLPSGVVRGKLGIIGNGVVLDPNALLSEIARVTGQGLVVGPENLRIAENVPLILPLHPALDLAREAARGEAKIGTTGRGIGPAYDLVVRFQGGHNAGHTLVVGNETYRLSLLPSGVVRGKLGIIGNGVVLDPNALLSEIARVTEQGLVVGPENLRIAENVPLILPLHPALDLAREAARGEAKIGTTGRGIGPAYEDKVARRAIRLCDLAEPATLSAKLDELLRHHNTLLMGLGAPTFEKQVLLDALLALAPKLLPFAEPVWERLDQARKAGSRILFEGAQAVMLDVDHGTYPFVTSSNTVAGNAAGGAGIAPSAIGTVLGIAKAYTTRVGAGPFPTELTDQTGALLGERGREFGTVTGRKRRCGWFDAALVRQAVKVGGIDALVLTKLDVLDGLPELKVCTGYEIAGRQVAHLPAAPGAQAAARPVYETMAGWAGSTRGARSWAQLPAEAIKYVKRIEELVEAPVLLLSTSPERDDTIVVKDPFAD